MLISQDAAETIDRVYGLDQLLYNGKKYIYFLPPGTNGDQFIFSTDFILGDVKLKGQVFTNASLNYDIYNQQLLLQYAGETGTFNIIEVSKAWLENFRLGDMVFQYLVFDQGPRFYQVIGGGTVKILYYWRKNLKLDAAYGSMNYTFSPPVKERFVLTGGNPRSFGNNRSFLALFEPGHKQEIRNYMHQNRIIVKKSTDRTMKELADFIGNLK
jgi:hypothetical protein